MSKGARLLSLFVSLASFLILFAPPSLAQSLASFSFNDLTQGSVKIAGVPFFVTITAKDEFGDTYTSFNSAVTLTDTTTSIYPTQTSDFSSGVWSGPVYITGATAATQITASYSGVNSNSDSFVVNADNRIRFLTIVTGNNQLSTVKTQLPTALTIKVVDTFNNPLPNIGVNFAVTSSPPGSSGYSLTNNTATTNGSGQASTSLTLGNKTGTYITTSTLTAGITNAAHFYTTANPSTLTSISLVPAVAVVPAGSFIPFSAIGYDQYLNQITLANPSWAVVNGGGTIDGTGVFYAGSTLGTFMNTVKATSNLIGSTATVTVVGAAGEAGGTSTTSAVPITQYPTPTPSAAGSLYNISISPDVITALSNATIPIAAQGFDATGQLLTDVVYTFQVEGDLGTITQTGPSTAQLTVGQSGIGAVTVTATQGDITRVSRVVGSVGNGLNRRLVIEEISSPQQVGVPFTISIAAKDSDNNFVTDYLGPIVLADTTASLDPPVVQPSQTGIWYIQGIISLASAEVTITVAGDGMIGVSNIFTVTGEPPKTLNLNQGPGQGFGTILGASISALIDQLMLDKDFSRFAVFRYIGAGIAAGFGILGASIGGGIMTSRGLEAIGRNPYAKTKLQFNLYFSLVGFILAASLAVLATFFILK